MRRLEKLVAAVAVVAFVGLRVFQPTTVEQRSCDDSEGFADRFDECYEAWRDDNPLSELVAVSATESATEYRQDRWLVVWSRPVHSYWPAVLLLFLVFRNVGRDERPVRGAGETEGDDADDADDEDDEDDEES